MAYSERERKFTSAKNVRYIQLEKPSLEVAPTTLRLALLILQFKIQVRFSGTLQKMVL